MCQDLVIGERPAIAACFGRFDLLMRAIAISFLQNRAPNLKSSPFDLALSAVRWLSPGRPSVLELSRRQLRALLLPSVPGH